MSVNVSVCVDGKLCAKKCIGCACGESGNNNGEDGNNNNSGNGNDSIALVNSPHLWEVGEEYAFADGSFGRRFTGAITASAKASVTTDLMPVTPDFVSIISVGGFWYRAPGFKVSIPSGGLSESAGSRIQLGGDNSTFNLVTICSGARTNMPYDVWVRYTKA